MTALLSVLQPNGEYRREFIECQQVPRIGESLNALGTIARVRHIIHQTLEVDLEWFGTGVVTGACPEFDAEIIAEPLNVTRESEVAV